MRVITILFCAFILLGCNSTPDTRTASPKTNSDINSIVEFLLNSAASDFDTNGPSVANLRNVRVGYLLTSSGEKQYRLCGEYLGADERAEPSWTPFATIKTVDYEQWIGNQALVFCNDTLMHWIEVDGLSAKLQDQLDTLR